MRIDQLIKNKPITIDENATIQEVLNVMLNQNLKRLLVLSKDGALIGVIERKDIAITMIKGLRSNIYAKDIAHRNITTIDVSTDIGLVSKLMADENLPFAVIVDGDKVESIVTRTDIFKILVELLGARHFGIRLSIQMEDKPGNLAELASILSKEGANIVSVGTIGGQGDSVIVTMKIQNIESDSLETLLVSKGIKILSIKEV